MLPVVVMILLLVLSVMSFQTNRFQMIELAAMSARSIARGEAPDTVKLLADEIDAEATIEIQHRGRTVCALAKKQSQLFWLGVITLEESQCARKNGL
ncbi:MAG: hypothetical protein ACKOFA_01300 [Rhodoluna sp.]